MIDKNIRLIKVFRMQSVDDLKGSIILYDSNLLPQSVFLFQQSVEKLLKSTALIYLECSPEQIVDSKHKAHTLAFKLFDQNILPFIYDVNHKQEIQKGVDFIRNFSKSRNYEKTDYIGFYNIMVTIDEIIHPKSKEYIKVLKDIRANFYNEAMNNFDHFKTIGQVMEIEKRFVEVGKRMIYLLILYLLDLLFSKFSITSRYPDIKTLNEPKNLSGLKVLIKKDLPFYFELMKGCHRYIKI